MPKKASRWFLPSLLLGVYLFLKLQGWLYARGVADFNRQLNELRPTLSAKALYEQLDLSRRAYTQAAEKIRRMDLKAGELLTWVSEHLPVSITLRRIQMAADRRFQIEGTLLPGIREPESALVAWAQTLRQIQPQIRILSFAPSDRPGAWDFQLEGAP